MTNDSYAGYLGVALRTVAHWHEAPETIPQQRNQEILDTALDRAPDRAKAQFALLVGEEERGSQSVGHVGSFGTSLSATNTPEFGDSEYLQAIRSHIHEIVAFDNRFGSADLIRISTRFFLNAPGKFLISAPEHDTPRRARAYLLTDQAVADTAARHAPYRPNSMRSRTRRSDRQTTRQSQNETWNSATATPTPAKTAPRHKGRARSEKTLRSSCGPPCPSPRRTAFPFRTS
jgi:hypothetical protein